MRKPKSDEYHVTTHVTWHGTLDWGWSATLEQPWPWTPTELDRDSGWCFTEKRAQRAADRAARRMLRGAAAWTTRTYNADGSVT